MSQTLKTLINTVAAEVYDLQDTKADRVELNGYVRTVQNDTNDASSLITLSKTGNVLSLNTENLRATLSQIAGNDMDMIDLANYINTVVIDNEDLEEYLKLSSDGHDLHLDYSKLLTLIASKSISSYGDDTDTGGYNLKYYNSIKSLKPSGYIQLIAYPNFITIKTTAALDTALAEKANKTDLPNMGYYIAGATENSTNGFPNTRLIRTKYTKFGSVHMDDGQLRPGAFIDIDMTILESTMDGKAPISNPTFTGTVSGITKAMVGLGNVDNKSDTDKPISTLTQAALDTLSATITTQGTAIAGKADTTALDSYYTKTQIDSSLVQKRHR